jgi:hypothetical protein
MAQYFAEKDTQASINCVLNPNQSNLEVTIIENGIVHRQILIDQASL